MLLDTLKRETRASHEQLERLNPLPTTRAGYAAQLAAFYGFVAPWEERLAAVLPEEDPIRVGRAKTAWLEADLTYFGCDYAALPRAAGSQLPSTSSRPEILGAAYVLEGSTLGGQMISQHAERTLGLSDGAGYRFHRSYGPRVGAQWQAFRSELLLASSPEADASIVRAARETFDLLHAWFSLQKVSLA